jgi:hypothetical protein
MVVVAVALLAGGVGGGVWALTRDDSSGNGAAGGARSSVTVTATAGAPSAEGSAASGSADASEGEGTLADPQSPPASAYASPSPGYSRAVDALGYTVDVPDGWVRSVDRRSGKPSVVHYSAPGGSAELELFEIIEITPADSLDQAENDPSFGFLAKLAGYEVIDRRTGADWAELTYRYDDEQDGPTQVVDHRFTAPDGTPYAIRSSGVEGTDVTTPFQMALGSFCPTGTACPSS